MSSLDSVTKLVETVIFIGVFAVGVIVAAKIIAAVGQSSLRAMRVAAAKAEEDRRKKQQALEDEQRLAQQAVEHQQRMAQREVETKIREARLARRMRFKAEVLKEAMQSFPRE